MPVNGCKWRLASTFVVTFVCAALRFGSLAESQDRFKVRWANDRLSVHASGAALSEVIAEVARLTGLKVVGADKLQGQLVVDFDDFAVTNGLKALLVDVNYFVQQEREVDAGRIGLILRVHSMARTDAVPVSTDRVLHVPALDAILEAEADEIEEAKEEEADDPDVEQENRENLHEAQQLVLNGTIGTKANIATLQRFLHDDNEQIRLEAVKALAQRPIADSLALLMEALGDDTIEVRRAAINALGRDRDPASLAKLGLALEKDPDPLVRQGAVRIFALRADAAVTVHLQHAVDDEEPVIREAAKQMLAEFERLARVKKP